MSLLIMEEGELGVDLGSCWKVEFGLLCEEITPLLSVSMSEPGTDLKERPKMDKVDVPLEDLKVPRSF